MNSMVLIKSDPGAELETLCAEVRKLTESSQYSVCFRLICRAMKAFPDAPEPHNLLGILFEKEGHHSDAMRHFRAAYALDPSYRPAQRNLSTYGTFYSAGQCDYGVTEPVQGQSGEKSYRLTTYRQEETI